jgi:hypothetical protein
MNNNNNNSLTSSHHNRSFDYIDTNAESALPSVVNYKFVSFLIEIKRSSHIDICAKT